jgi:hypothetical protein
MNTSYSIAERYPIDEYGGPATRAFLNHSGAHYMDQKIADAVTRAPPAPPPDAITCDARRARATLRTAGETLPTIAREAEEGWGR